MSTGANCRIIEKAPGQWFYELQQYPYGETETYDVAGPFPTFQAAHTHLHKHNANPGGYWRKALPGCPHDLKRPTEFFHGHTHVCDRCGEAL